MKARITQKSELTLELNQAVTFDVLTDDGETVLTSQTIEAQPSLLTDRIKEKLAAYQAEYDISQQLEVGEEII